MGKHDRCFIEVFDRVGNLKDPNAITKIYFQNIPDEMAWGRDVAMQSVNIVGRNTPSYHYAGGETLLTMQLDFYAEEQDRLDVLRKTKWLESLTYNQGVLNAPPRVIIGFGDMFSVGGDKNPLWVIKDIKPRYSLPHAFYDYLPTQVYIDITFARWAERPINGNDIRSGYDPTAYPPPTDADYASSKLRNSVYVKSAVSNKSTSFGDSIKAAYAPTSLNIGGLDRNVDAAEALRMSTKTSAIKVIEQIIEYGRIGYSLTKF